MSDKILTKDDFEYSYHDENNEAVYVLEKCFTKKQVEQILENEIFCNVIQDYFSDKLVGDLSPEIIIKYVDRLRTSFIQMAESHKNFKSNDQETLNKFHDFVDKELK